jgi:guanylate kinase
LNPTFVFIAPPSLDSLHSRLTGRGTESETSLAARLSAAHGELAYAATGAFDVVVVNDDVDRAYNLLKSIIIEGKKEGDELPAFDHKSTDKI